MANSDKDVRKAEQQSQDQGGQLNEASPNPQGQTHMAQTPVRTDHSDATGGDNVAQSTSTRDGALNPSVADHVSGHVRQNDSMFNNADPQTAAILEQETKERNEAAKREYERKSPKDRKSA
jgi:hypothetical protein